MYFYSVYLNRILKKVLIGLVLFLSVVVVYQYFLHNDVMATKTLKAIERGNDQKKEMALTINVVWGNEYLPSMLDTLKKNKVKATFFIGGQWAEDNPQLLKRITSEGHDIQSHGYSHPHPTLLSKEENKEEITKTEKIIQKITGKKTNLFAPPYGEYNQTVLEAADELKYKTIYWSVDTIDWQKPSPDVLIQRVTDKAQNGGIVLMHPTDPTSRAMNDLIKQLNGKGYKLVTVSDMLKG